MKDNLKNIFQNSYPGINVFISDVLTPIFSEDFIEGKNVNLIVSDEIKKRANNANILKACHVADIDRIDSDPIAVYDVTLKPNSKITHSRVAIKQFITALSMTYTHVFIVFHYDNEPERPWRFSYVYKESTIAGTRGTAKRYTYVFGKDYHCRTAIDRFVELANSPKTDADFAKAFSVETLSDEFFDEYRERYADFVQYITGKRYVKESNKWVERKQCEPNDQYNSTFDCDDKLVRDYIKKMFGRIVFLYFLQRKGWLAKNKQYMHDLYYNSEHKDNFLDDVLEPLFFEVLNTDIKYRTTEAKKLPDSDNIPYLNGGLFARDEIDELQCVFPKEYFKQLFDFLDSYNFTIDENDPEDAEVGIDPEMLGRIFENLLEDNKDKGAFYTPKEIVDYMCRESIIAYLINGIPERSHQLIRSFVEDLDAEPLNDEQRIFLRKKLQSVRICDPAIGSGAFPMGLVNLLSKLYIALKSDTDTVKMKRHIMENNIYGVDIEKGAVDIARLRFWLAMIVEEKEPMPLPNLHFKIMQGNSLLECYKGVNLSDLTQVNGQSSIFDSDNAERDSLVKLLSKYYKTSDHKERDRIFNDIKNNVYRQLYAKGIILPSEISPSANDKFFLWHTWFADVFEKGGFDIVIGNPPYIKELGNEQIFAPVIGSSWGKKYHAGKMDYWYYFLHKAIEITNKNGTIGFITSRYWINSSGAKKIIKHVSEETSFLNIVDIGKLKVFDNVVGHHMISILTKDKSKDICQYCSISDDVKNIEKNIFTKQKFIKRDNLFSNGEIVIEDRIVSNTTLVLDDVCNIAQGVVEASDKISAKMYKRNPNPNHFIGEGIFVLSFDECDKLNLSDDENNIMVLFEDNGCLSRYNIDYSKTRKLIYADTHNRTEIAKNPKFLNLKNHLDRMSEYITSTYKPYGLHRARKYSDFTQPKLIGPSMFVLPCYSYDTRNLFVGMSYNIITPKADVNLKFILAIINSRYAQKWFYSNAKHRGAGVDVGVDKLRTFPIPNATSSQQNLLAEIVDIIIDKKNHHNDYDTSSMENQIDNIVYHLYGLSYNEILIIDPETSITREEYEIRYE